MNELALFAGGGGGILGGKLLGWRTICAVEIEPYPASVLMRRQNEGFLPPFPIWDDVCTFSGLPWRGYIDVVSGGFPCQDISSANRTAQGISGSRSGLWREFKRIIGETEAPVAFIENTRMLTRRGLGVVLKGIYDLGYYAEWMVLGASDCGAWHKRERVWILAYNPRIDRVQRLLQESMAGKFRIPWCQDVRNLEEFRNRSDVYSPQLCGAGNGMADYVDRIKTIGNGQVPLVAATAFQLLANRVLETF